MSRRRFGFTLIELLVVIAIVGLLASIVIASTKNARDKAKNARITADIMEYAKALALYQSDNGGNNPSLPPQYSGVTMCLGGGYLGGKCGLNNLKSEDESLNSLLRPYFGGNLPPVGNNMRVDLGSSFYVGATYTSIAGGAVIETYLQGRAPCPNPQNVLGVYTYIPPNDFYTQCSITIGE